MSEPVTVSQGITVEFETYNGVDYVSIHADEHAGAFSDDHQWVHVPLADRLAFAAAVAPDGYQVVPVRLPRAECPVCEHEYALTRSGGMRRHADPTTTWYRDCAGSGVQPKAATS